MSKENIERFRTQLSNLSWRNVTNTDDTNIAFEYFWNDFNALFELTSQTTFFDKRAPYITQKQTRTSQVIYCKSL